MNTRAHPCSCSYCAVNSLDQERAYNALRRIRATDGHDSSAFYEFIDAYVVRHLIRHWHRKRLDYEGGSLELGTRGQFSDIWRKLGKLKSTVWEGKRLIHEDAAEITRDLLGHVFLLYALLFWESLQRGQKIDSAFDLLPEVTPEERPPSA